MDRKEAERIYDAGREAVVEALMAFDARIRKLEETIARLTRNSSNSSRPPSSDPPGSIKLKRKKPSRRKQGGQPGHKGKKRELLPAAEMDHIHDLFPGQCSSCNRPFDPSQQIFSSQPYRHQVAELPKITPELTEYRCHTLRCSCGQETVASLPDEVARSEFGPGVHAAIGYLMATHRVSRRGIVDIFATLFNLHIATGTVCNAAERVAEACRPVIGAIKKYVAAALTLNADETGWKNQGKRRYLWTLVADRAALFHISPSRGAKVLRELLGDSFAGIITSDDHSAYHSYHKKGRRQLCWAHLIRKLKALKQDCSSPHAYCFAKNMLKEIGAMFARWHAFDASGGSREKLCLDTMPIRQRMFDYCTIFRHCPDPKVQTRTKRLLANWQHLFTFLEKDGVEPTNNAAERALRPAVQWRKNCYGSQSHIGERFAESLLSVTATCKLHDVNAFHFLTAVVRASFSTKHSLPELSLALPN